ncbi:MAG TPA: hypothetical protein VJQ56_02060, partial [Blastocatellia bacterium]|nr:hypothetical protein [Blastocatellia bacterium]
MLTLTHYRSIVLLILFSLVPASVVTPGQAQGQEPYRYAPSLVEELERLQQAALASDYDYRQVAYLS